MNRFIVLLSCCLIIWNSGYGQSPSFKTYMNPVIPGDHPDPTLTRIGNDFYTTGSSFNPTPIIYHSTDLVHWEAISQPVSASWNLYGDEAGGGVWGGHMVYHLNSFWHFFGRNGTMYFVKADDPAGPWSVPEAMICPATVPGLGQDNSIFIDDNGRWYLLVKNGQQNNWIVELREDGQPAGDIHDLTWINPASAGYPFSWAEGPVMWKNHGDYFYCFAYDLSGGQFVFKSDTLTGTKSSWTNLGDFFSYVPNIYVILFREPNHCSAAIMLDDSTSWVIYHAYSKGNFEWHGLGRQGMLSQVRYNALDKPEADYPSNDPMIAPNLPSSGIPWMIPKSDFFDSATLNPEWSFLGYTPEESHSLTERPGWFKLSPKGKENTIVKNDAEHNYSLITRLDFNAASVNDEAGFWIFNGLQTLFAKLYSTINDSGTKVIRFSFDKTQYETENTVGNILWLKLFRENHILTGYFSSDSVAWTSIGKGIDVSSMDKNQANYNAFTGSRQGLFVKGSPAYFDLYIYRDAYSSILTEPPANQYGTLRPTRGPAIGYLDSLHHNDWAMYAGVEFGGADYPKMPVTIEMIASSATTGGTVEVWLDSLDTGNKIAECNISNTGDWKTFKTFTAPVESVSGRHDVYLKFTGSGTGRLFQLKWLRFLTEADTVTSVDESSSLRIPQNYVIKQNYPNPFNPTTKIEFGIPKHSFVSLKIYNLRGEEVGELAGKEFTAGVHAIPFDASHLASGLYFYTIKTRDYLQTKKMMLIK